MATNLDYSQRPEFGGPLPPDDRDMRNDWWNGVLDFTRFHGGGDFVELKNCRVTWNTILKYKKGDNPPAAFLDPMFEIEKHKGKIYVRYLPDEKA